MASIYALLITTDLALRQKSLQQLLAIQTWKQREGAVLSPCKGMVSLLLKERIWFGYLSFSTHIFKGNKEGTGMQKVQGYLEATKTGQ